MSVPLGICRLQFSPDVSTQVIPKKPLFLTNHGDGKQLTLEPSAIGFNQDFHIRLPLEGKEFDKDSEYRIIIPAHASEFEAVSQDVVKSPDEVFLIKNLQVWSFQSVENPGAEPLYEIRSNLYAGLVGATAFLGVDKDHKKAVIQHIPVIPDPPSNPVWKLVGPVGPSK